MRHFQNSYVQKYPGIPSTKHQKPCEYYKALISCRINLSKSNNIGEASNE